MEVPHAAHSHSHSNSHSKNWKSYFGEFLMLFLAVFSGFIAENLRENYVEKEKAHEYAVSMVSDLEKDTLQLQMIIDANKKLLKGIDTLLIYLKSPPSDSVSKKLYVFGSYVGISVLFETNNGTITQLKNAGGLRLIKDTASVNHIMAYDQYNERIKKQGDAYYKLTMEILNIMEEIMDFSVAVKPAAKPVFYISRDPDKVRIFYNKCYMQKQIISGYTSYLGFQKKEAVKDITLLRKNYHIRA
jgi:hypothetical protein